MHVLTIRSISIRGALVMTFLQIIGKQMKTSDYILLQSVRQIMLEMKPTSINLSVTGTEMPDDAEKGGVPILK